MPLSRIFAVPWFLLGLFLCLSCLGACSPRDTTNRDEGIPAKSSPVGEESPEAEIAPFIEGPFGEDPFREAASRAALAMDDRLLAAQCLLAGLDNKPFLTEPIKALFERIPPGGVMLFGFNLTGTRDEIRSFLTGTSDFIETASGISPFIGVDHEGGAVHRFGRELTRLPAPASFWEMAGREGEEAALKAVEDRARLSGGELRDLGINLNLAPVAEVLTPENRGFLEERSYGPDPGFTEKAAKAFIRGMEAAGVACAIKHFPGHGKEDPHDKLPIIALDPPGLDAMIAPFRGVIADSWVPALMVSHAMVPAIDPQRNASLSPRVISSWLRGELGFQGIVLADDFSMGAVAAQGIAGEEAVVQALNAGVDMVMCWPQNMAALHNAILSAVKENRLSRERLREAAERIIAGKLRYGTTTGGRFLE